MKKYSGIQNIGICTIMFLCLLRNALGAEFEHRNIKEIIERHLEDHPHILDSSKDKDIVIFLGNTGAGKSTLINYLNGTIDMRVNGLGDIVLSGHNGLPIGEGSESHTSLPAMMQVGDQIFYDFPGFKDTRGTARSLVNAAFIKHIVENARNVKIIFVAGIDQITTDRGISFKSLLTAVGRILPKSKIEAFSGLVITKSYIGRAGLADFLDTKLTPCEAHDLYLLYAWIENNRIEQMSRPTRDIIAEDDKESILNLIHDIGHEKVIEVDTGTIFDQVEEAHILQIYNNEILAIINRLLVNLDRLSGLDIATLEKRKSYLAGLFRAELESYLEQSHLLKLLRALSENIYQASLSQQLHDLSMRLLAMLGQIDSQIKEQQRLAEEEKRKAAERALRESEAQRVQQESARRQAEQRAQRAEAELRAQKAAEAEKIRKATLAQAAIPSQPVMHSATHDHLKPHKERAWANYSATVALYRRYFSNEYTPSNGIFTLYGKANQAHALKILQTMANGIGLPTKVAPNNIHLTRADFEDFSRLGGWAQPHYDPYKR